MKKIMKRPPVTPNDIDSVMGMLAALQGVWLEAKTTKSEDGLNKDQIIQDLLTEKLSFMAEGFFKKQYKMMKLEPTHRRGFHDVIEDLEEKAHIMKSIGMSSKSTTSSKEKNLVKMAPAQVQNGPKTFSDVVAKSPPKTQQPLPVKEKCEFCEKAHKAEDCPTLMTTESVFERREMARKKGLCFRCMKREKHIAYNCPGPMPKCGVCKKAHKTCFHNYQPKESEETSTSSSTTKSSGQKPSSTGEENGSPAPPTGTSGGETAAL